MRSNFGEVVQNFKLKRVGGAPLLILNKKKLGGISAHFLIKNHIFFGARDQCYRRLITENLR